MAVESKERFWQGFERGGQKNPSSFKKHVIILYWSKDNEKSKTTLDRLRIRHPSVKVKLVNGDKEGSKLTAHSISKLPTVLLLKNGREVDRVVGDETTKESILSQLFRRANT